MSSASPPDYYKILSVSPTATPQQIREAYKRAALEWHPDRVATDSPERAERTKKFQRINDAYYTLSDPSRRKDYDSVRKFHQQQGDSSTAEDADEEIPRPPPQQQRHQRQWGSGFPWSAFGFDSGAQKADTHPTQNESEEREFCNEQFGDVFEEMLRDEGLAEGADGQPTGKFWSIVGGISGGAMGFIVANLPGAIAGGVGGNRLGAIRDAKGKSVYAVFQELPQSDKARLLSQLAGKVFATVASGA